MSPTWSGDVLEARPRTFEHRRVEERVRELPAEGGTVDFLCECGDEECVEQIRLTPANCERVRSHPVQFFVKRGDEIPDVEEVIDEHERFLVVRKYVEQQEIARAAHRR